MLDRCGIASRQQRSDLLVRRPRSSEPPLRSLLTHRRFRLSLLLIFLAATPGWAVPEYSSFETGSRVVSPSVVATCIVRNKPDGASQLELLVLWRGNPGWFMRADSEESSSSHGSVRTAGDDKGGEVFSEQLSYGGLSLEWEYDRGKHTARVQNHDVSVKSSNVILVDEVDAADGPQIAGSLEVDPSFASEPAGVEAVARRSPEIYAFLRCDGSVADANTQSAIEAMCARMKPN